MNLTREDILNEPAGPRLDAWVAEKVMGWTLVQPVDLHMTFAPRRAWQASNGTRTWQHEWNPSVDMNDAMKVLHALGKRGWWVLTMQLGQSALVERIVLCQGDYHDASATDDRLIDLDDEIDIEPPLAVCRAALLTTLDTHVEGEQA